MKGHKSLYLGIAIFTGTALGFSLFDAAVPERPVRIAVKEAFIVALLLVSVVTVLVYNVWLHRFKHPKIQG